MPKKGSEGRGEAVSLPESKALDDLLVEAEREVLADVVNAAFDRRRPQLAFELQRVLSQADPLDPTATTASASAAVKSWVAVESLSRLRSLVGGRFQNVKDRWVEAGFPLREHRGEELRQVTPSEKGWLELSTWIAKQGFEARLTPESKDGFFEVRRVGE